MKLANQLPISPVKEGLNVFRVFPSYKLGKIWSRPVSVNFIITSRCNSKCVTCDSWKLTDHDNELTTEEFQRLANEISEMNIPIVTIGGGEPTLRKDIWDIIRAFKEKKRVTQLTTNALTLRKDQHEKMYESGLDRVTVSVDSHLPELYLKIRGVDGAQSVLKNLEEMLQNHPKHVEVDTNTVLCKDNADTFLDTLDFLIQMGVPKVNFSAVTTFGSNYLMTESKETLAGIPKEKLEQIVEGLLKRKRQTSTIQASTAFIEGIPRYYANPQKVVYPCYAGYLTIDIFQDGSIHGCGNLPAFSNVRDARLKEIWESPEAKQNRINMAQGKCPNCYLSCKMELAIAANPKHLPRFSLEKLFTIA